MTQSTFHALLRGYAERRGWHTPTLANHAKLPRNTVANWLRATGPPAPMPRHWQDVLKLAHALALSRAEVDELLHAAGHRSLTELAELVSLAGDKEEHALIARWLIAVQAQGEPKAGAMPNRSYALFCGRAAELALLHTYTSEPQVRVIAVSGLSGIGKSSLVAEFATQHGLELGYTVCNLSIRELGFFSVEGIAVALMAQLLGVALDQASAVSVFGSRLSRENVLIVLDNLNTLTAAQQAQLIEFLRNVLPESGRSKAILTTQLPIRELTHWSFAREICMHSGLSTDEALRLIYHHMPHMDAADETIACAVTERIWGHPKLLEAVIGRAKRWGWSRVHDEVMHLSGELATSTWGIIRQSTHGLGEESERVLERATVFQTGAFTLGEMCSLVDDGIDAAWGLEQLVDAGLASYNPALQVYRVHQLIAESAKKQLGVGGNLDHMHGHWALRLAKHYIDVLQETGTTRRMTVTVLQNAIATAQRWSTPKIDLWATLQALLAHYFYRHRDFVNAVMKYERVLALTADRPCKDRADALHGLAILQSGPHAGHFHTRDAIDLYRRCIVLRHQLGDRVGVAYALNDLAYQSLYAHSARQAHIWLRQSLVIAALCDKTVERDWQLHGIIQRTTGHFYRDCGDRDRALKYYAASMSLLAEAGDFIELANTAAPYGSVMLDIGQIELGIATLRHIIDVVDASGEPSDLTNVWSTLGKAYTLKADWEMARDAYQQSVRCAETFGTSEAAVIHYIAMYGLGRIDLRRGDPESALGYLNASLERRIDMGHTRGIPDVRWLIAEALKRLGDVEGEQQQHLEILKLLANSRTPEHMVLCQRAQARLNDLGYTHLNPRQ